MHASCEPRLRRSAENHNVARMTTSWSNVAALSAPVSHQHAMPLRKLGTKAQARDSLLASPSMKTCQSASSLSPQEPQIKMPLAAYQKQRPVKGVSTSPAELRHGAILPVLFCPFRGSKFGPPACNSPTPATLSASREGHPPAFCMCARLRAELQRAENLAMVTRSRTVAEAETLFQRWVQQPFPHSLPDSCAFGPYYIKHRGPLCHPGITTISRHTLHNARHPAITRVML